MKRDSYSEVSAVRVTQLAESVLRSVIAERIARRRRLLDQKRTQLTRLRWYHKLFNMAAPVYTDEEVLACIDPMELFFADDIGSHAEDTAERLLDLVKLNAPTILLSSRDAEYLMGWKEDDVVPSTSTPETP